MPDTLTEEKPSGVAYVLARLKGFWAAILPLYTIYQSATSDGSITEQEYGEIGKALVFFVGVWLIPNLGYVRRLRDRYGRPVVQGVDDTVTTKLPDSATSDTPGRHEFEDRDQDGVSDAEELRLNEGGHGARPAARRLRDGDWPAP